MLIDPKDGGHLYLMEVKNYRTRITGDGEFKAMLKPVNELTDDLFGKFLDTEQAIRAIRLFYVKNGGFHWSKKHC